MSASSSCPRCAVPTLVHAEHDGRTMLACTRCAGVWLDDTDAQGLLAPLTDLHDRTAAYPPVPCPRCGEGMPAQYSAMANVEVDRCEEHGVWFDRDEVAHIAHAIAQMRGEPPPALPDAYAHGSGMALGAAVVGVAVGAASIALDSASGAQRQQQQQSAESGSVDAVDAVLMMPEGLATEGAAAAVEAAGEVAGGAVETISSVDAGELASGALDVGGGAVEAISSVDMGELASGALEVGGGVLEGAGEVLGAVLGGIAEVLGGL